MKHRNLFGEIDFQALYAKQRALSSFGPRTAADWDARAELRNRRDLKSSYNQAFLERVRFDGIRTALDIGCGVGNLAIPLARRLRKVYAMDFSREMLRHLWNNVRRADLSNVEVFLLAWEDSWAALPPADLVVCSRAMSAPDLRAALEKMHRQARKRCCLTLNVGGSYLGSDLARRLGRPIAPGPDYIYAVNLLYQMGIRATVDFIRSEGGSAYTSAGEFVAGVRWRLGRLSSAEEKRVRQFYRSLPKDKEGRALHGHEFEWAFLTWDK